MANSKNTVKVLTEAEFLDFLRVVTEAAGGLSALSRSSTVHKSNLHKTLRGKRKPGPMLLKSLGIRETRAYVLPAHWAEWLDGQD